MVRSGTHRKRNRNALYECHVSQTGYVCESRSDVLQVTPLQPSGSQYGSGNDGLAALIVEEWGAPDKAVKRLYFRRYAQEGAVLCIRSAEGGPNQHTYYEPMKKLGLFRAFGKLQETPQAVLDFAGKYGLLGLPGDGVEPLEHWYAEIRDARDAIRAYDLVTQERIEELYPHEPWRTDSKVTRDDMSIYAIWELTRTVNTKLSGQASPVLVSPTTSNVSGMWPTGLVFKPHSLLAALWLQLAYELAGLRKRQVCQACGKQFWLKSAVAEGRDRRQRSDTMYCSSKCKVNACRDRKRNAARTDADASAT